ncbi:MAG: hypothetical protein LAP87_19900 [Acidobacteriia bacterium]|nr:hypothetical protein [Terriglobia bacterium]
MTAFAWILLLAAATSVDLVDEVYQIPASEWRYVEIELKQKPALVSARYQVEAGAREVRLALLRREDIERLREDLPHGHLAETPPGATGRLEYPVLLPGVYVILVDNLASHPTAVHLRVRLDFGASPGVARLSRQRQLAVVLISFAVFFGIVTFSARRLLRAIKR